MKSSFILTLAALLAVHPGQAAQADAAPDNQSNGSGLSWLSILLPRSMQKNPRVDFNVITEMTPAGRRRPEASASNPVYYHLHSVGYRRLGDGAPGGEHPPAPEGLMEGMRNALAENGYFEMQDATGTPDLVLITYWGSYTSAGFDAQALNDQLNAQEANPDAPPRPEMNMESAETLLPLVLSDLRKRQELLERASLVGGVKFAGELQKVLNEEVNFADQRENEERLAAMMQSAAGGDGFVAGAVLAFQNMNPFYRFKNRDAKTNYLVEQAFGSMYFVVASAYDYKTMADPQKLLLWRTKMTVDSSGVAMRETLPRLIANAAPFFGRDMPEPTTVRTRINREGKVEIGPATVIEEAVE